VIAAWFPRECGQGPASRASTMQREVVSIGPMNIDPIALAQEAVCRRYGLALVAAPPHLKVGIARNVRDGVLPISGLRHPPAGETTGWSIWAGEELSHDPAFFVPLHVAHLAEWCPAAVRYLGLPPGWRFLVSGDHEDVWEDPALCDA